MSFNYYYVHSSHDQVYNSRWPAVIITSGKKPGQKSHFNLYFLAANNQAIKKNNVANVFQNWGDWFKLEFSIKVTKIPTSVWTNVFHFTVDDGNGNINASINIPALFIKKDGYFQVCSAVSGNQKCKNYYFELGKRYHIIIEQSLDFRGKTYYNINIDGDNILFTENTHPRSFQIVKLYASDPWSSPFSADLGNICNVKIEEGKLRA